MLMNASSPALTQRLLSRRPGKWAAQSKVVKMMVPDLGEAWANLTSFCMSACLLHSYRTRFAYHSGLRAHSLSDLPGRRVIL